MTIVDVHHHWMPKEHLRDMDQAKVDMAVLSISIWQEWNTMDIAPFINDKMAEIQQKYHDRIIGLAHVPPFEKGATEELDRAIKQLGLKGICLTTHHAGKYLDAKEYLPLYQKVSELDVPIVVHASYSAVEHQMLIEHNLTIQLGRAIDHTITVARLLCSGILKDFPNLKFVMGHLGGTFFALKNRLTIPTLPERAEVPVSYLDQIYFDSAPANWTEPELSCAIKTLGVDKIVFGSDYPIWHDGMKRMVQLISELPIAEEEKEKIFSKNALSIFKVTQTN